MKNQKMQKICLLFLVILILAGKLYLKDANAKAKKESEVIHIVLQRSAENCQDFYLVENELNQYLAKTEDFQVQFKIVDEKKIKNDFLQNLKSEEPIDLLFGDMQSMNAN